jgi:hypothetical protein
MLTRAPTTEVRDWHSDSRHWDRYKPREGDIVIGTAAKVGTTWTSQIINLLVFQSPEPRTIGLMSPWLDARIFAPLDVMIANLEAQTHRRFIKTHLRMDAVPIYDEVKYIHTARDGRDAAMSYMNHLNSHTAGAWARFDEIGASDPTLGGPMPRAPGTPSTRVKTTNISAMSARLIRVFTPLTVARSMPGAVGLRSMTITSSGRAGSRSPAIDQPYEATFALRKRRVLHKQKSLMGTVFSKLKTPKFVKRIVGIQRKPS